MRVERHDMGEDAAEREGLGRIAKRVDKRVIPCGAISDFPQNTMQFRISFFEPFEHRFGRTLRGGRAVHIHFGPGQRGGPDFFREQYFPTTALESYSTPATAAALRPWAVADLVVSPSKYLRIPTNVACAMSRCLQSDQINPCL